MKKILLGLLLFATVGVARGQIVNMLCSDNTNANCTNAGAGATASYNTPDSEAIDCASYSCDFHTFAATTSSSIIFLDCKADIKDTAEDWYPCYQGTGGQGIVNVGNYQQSGVSSFVTAARAGFYRVRATITGGTVYVKAVRYKRVG